MTIDDIEAFLDTTSINRLVILKHPDGWQLGISARPGSPLHLREAGLSESYRIARGATLGEAFDAMVALAVPAVDLRLDEDIFG